MKEKRRDTMKKKREDVGPAELNQRTFSATRYRRGTWRSYLPVNSASVAMPFIKVHTPVYARVKHRVTGDSLVGRTRMERCLPRGAPQEPDGESREEPEEHQRSE